MLNCIFLRHYITLDFKNCIMLLLLELMTVVGLDNLSSIGPLWVIARLDLELLPDTVK